MKTDNNSVSSSFLWKLSERFFSVGVSVVIQIILARILSPSDFGKLAILMAIINFASLFISSGISTAIIQKKELDNDDISTTIVMCMVVATIVYFVLFFMAPVIADVYESPELKWGLRVLSTIVFFNSFNSIQIALLARKMNFKKIFVRSAIAVPLSGALGIFLAFNGFGVWSLIIHSISTSVFTVLIMAVGNKQKVGLHFSRDKAKKIYSFSGYILFASLTSGISDMLRSLIIGKRYSKNDLAYYDKGYTYTTYVSQAAKESVTAVLLPTFSRQQSNLSKLHDMARRSVRIITFISFPILIGFALVSEEFVRIVLTNKWLNMVPFLVVFCVLRLSDLLKSIDIQVYYALGKTKFYFIYAIAVNAINILVMLLMTNFGPLYIAIGAMTVELLSAIIIFCISSFVYKYALMERIQDICKPIISCCAMAIFIYLFSLLGIDNLWISLILKVIIGIFTYFIVEFLLKDRSLAECVDKLRNIKIKRH